MSKIARNKKNMEVAKVCRDIQQRIFQRRKRSRKKGDALLKHGLVDVKLAQSHLKRAKANMSKMAGNKQSMKACRQIQHRISQGRKKTRKIRDAWLNHYLSHVQSSIKGSCREQEQKNQAERSSRGFSKEKQEPERKEMHCWSIALLM